MTTAALSLHLLGPFQATVNGSPVESFRSSKAQALLVYLAVEGCLQPATRVRRDALQALLWPDYPEQSARQNLRSCLYLLRQALSGAQGADTDAGDPYLLADRQTVQLNPDLPCDLDVYAFLRHLDACSDHRHESLATCPACLAHLQRAVDLYRDDFLCDFYLDDSAPFEEWAGSRRAELRRRALDGLATLTDACLQRLAFLQAERYARRQLGLDNLRESAHRQLMTALAEAGRRSQALAQYETCRLLLADELGVEPSPSTAALYQRIRAAETSGPLPVPPVRGYELLEQIGSGAFGVVHRARQQAVDREVAVKVILPQYANHPEFIRRFETEAQMVARLEHPHIVPLYDYWREPDRACLVMRWLRGGNLRQSLAAGPWSPESVADLLGQLADGLDAAHRQGVVHRDIKPANILLDEDGNGYLSDFGIAKDIAIGGELTRPGGVLGSPAYAAPEQLQGEGVTPRTDLYSLGIVLYELLTGSHPFPDASIATLIHKQLHEPLPSLGTLRPQLPGGLDGVLQRTTAKEPGDRYPGVLVLAAAFRQALGSEPPVGIEAAAPLYNPYKGLRPFQEADAADFYGRGALVDELVAKLAASDKLLAVVGPSGSGKSSVVRAGLLPALREDAVPGSANWFVVEMLPGSHPLEELEARLLRIAVNPPASLLGQLREDERGLLRAVKRVLPDEKAELLLLVDQFEELFTLVDDADRRQHFLDSLCAAVTDSRSCIRVLLTLRADFYDRPLSVPEFGELIRHHTTAIVPLTPEELGEAVTAPAANVGVAVEPGLLAAIVGDVSRQPGGLPLLQYALTELFERRDGPTMTQAMYAAMGGVSGALARRAEEIFAGFDAADQAAAEQIFLRLVTLGEGVEDTRRRVLRGELAGLVDETDTETVDTVVDAYGRHRLLTFDRDPLTRGPTVEVAHEALLREWPRLRGWLEEARDDIRQQRLLGAAAAEWAASGKDPGYLLRGSRLSQFTGWAEATSLALTAAERGYLDASLEARRVREEAEQARLAREAALERRARTILRALAGVFLLAAIIAGGLALYANGQREEAERQRQEALRQASIGLAAQARGELSGNDPERAVLLALEALAHYPYAPQAESALAEAVEVYQSSFILMNTGSSSRWFAARWSPDGRYIAAGAEGGLSIGEVANRSRVVEIEISTQLVCWVTDLAWSPDGTRLVSITVPSGVSTADEEDCGPPTVWIADGGEKALVLDDIEDLSHSVSWSPDGTEIILGSATGDIIIWRIAAEQVSARLAAHDGAVDTIAWSPEGGVFATAGADGNVHIWDAASRERLLTVPEKGGPVNDLAWSPLGDVLAVGTDDGLVRLWNAATGELEQMLSGHRGPVYRVSWSANGRRMATLSEEGKARMWDVASGRELYQIPGNFFPDDDIGFGISPDGTMLATNHRYDLVIWDIAETTVSLGGHTDTIRDGVWSPDGTRIVTSSHDGTTRIWDAATGEELRQLQHQGYGLFLDWSPDSSRVITTEGSGPAKVWDATTGELLLTLPPFDEGSWSVDASWSPDGTRFVVSYYIPQGYARAVIYDAETGDYLLEAERKDDYCHVSTLSWSPDSRYLVNGCWFSLEGGSAARVWDAATGATVMELDANAGHTWSAEWSADGKYIAAGTSEGLVGVWDAATGELLSTFTGHASALAGVGHVAWPPSGTRIASSDDAGNVRVWEALTGEEVMSFSSPGIGWHTAWNPAGTEIISVGLATLPVIRRVWPDMETLIDHAYDCCVTRELTLEERAQFGLPAR